MEMCKSIGHIDIDTNISKSIHFSSKDEMGFIVFFFSSSLGSTMLEKVSVGEEKKRILTIILLRTYKRTDRQSSLLRSLRDVTYQYLFLTT